MELLNGAEFEQNQVVVGQQTVTRGMGVSDDPMLMSLLSTSLYQKPLKSMAQEALFNAWDAHKAAGNTDKPIEIVITEDHQLIISDSGLGIAPENMYDIYCVYGASTKRKDNDQTGGFGLGCKAPFAYTESFRVTSAHGGKRSVYLLSRANDENEGKPGITTLVEGLDCKESGLIVSIPLKNRSDARRLYGYLKNDILPYSGIKWTLQYFDEPLEEGQEDTLGIGQFIIEDGRMDKHGGLIAQYGGVAYPVPMQEEIQEEYNTLCNLIGSIGRLRAGFAPGTLTPLPSREGLNLSESTVKNLKAQMKILIEELSTTVKPIFELAIQWTAFCLGERNVEETYVYFGNLGGRKNIDDVLSDQQIRRFLDEPPMEGIRPDLYQHIAKCCVQRTADVIKGVGKNWLLKRRAVIWSHMNGHNRVIFDYLKNPESMINNGYNYSTHSYGPLAKLQKRENVRNFIKIGIRLFEDLGIKPHFRIFDGYYANSHRLTNVVKSHFPNYYSSGKNRGKAFKSQNRVKTNRMVWHKLFYRSDELFEVSKDTVFVSRTIKDVDNQQNQYEFRDENNCLIPIIITGVSEKNFKKAIKFLEAHGYTVHEIEKYEEPPIDPDKPSTSTKDLGWPKLSIYSEGFANETYLSKNPTLFLVYSRTRQLEERWSKDSLSRSAIITLEDMFPYDDIVVINHPNKIPTLEKAGAINIKDRFKQMVDDIFADTDFKDKLLLHHYVHESGDIPSALSVIPEFSKLLGIPYIRTKERVKFSRQMRLINFLTDNRSDVLCDPEVREDLFTKTSIDPAVFTKYRKILDELSIINKRQLERKLLSMNDGERLMYAQKLARFIRTTAD